MYDYLLEYVKEGVDARKSVTGGIGLTSIIKRSLMAYRKMPQKNYYKSNAYTFFQEQSKIVGSQFENCNPQKECDSIPDGTNDTIFNAVETVVSMAMGGVSQFECKPLGSFDVDGDVLDRQEAYLEHAYHINHLDGLASDVVRKLFIQGQVNFHIKPLANKGEYKISLIDAYKMILDPRRTRTNRERFIGYTEVQSWQDVKDYLKIDDDGVYLKTINDVDVYVGELQHWRLEGTKGMFEDELSQDMAIFESIYAMPHQKGTPAVDKDGKELPKDKQLYHGDNVEVSYLWDLDNSIEAVIINRRFIVKAKKNTLKRTLRLKSYKYNPEKDQHEEVETPYTLELAAPVVHQGFIQLEDEALPVTPLWYCLDDFDMLCSKESILEHNLSIMSPITFVATSYDAELMQRLGQIAGQIIEGSSATMGVWQKGHDMSSITASINRSETRIKRMLGATDQYELMQLMNNRATGAEVSMANAAVSQRLNIVLSKLEDAYLKVMETILKLDLLNSDGEITFPYKDGIEMLTPQEILGTRLTQVRLKSRIKVEQKEQSQNALMVLQTLIGLAGQGVKLETLLTTLVPRILQGTVSRREALALLDDNLNITPSKMQEIIQQERAAAKVEQANLDAQYPFGQADLDEETIGTLEQLLQNPEQMEQASYGQPAQEQGLMNSADGGSLLPNVSDPELAGQLANDGFTPTTPEVL